MASKNEPRKNTKNQLPPDPLIDYDKDGAPISRQLENEADALNVERGVENGNAPSGLPLMSNRSTESTDTPADANSTARSQYKKRQGTEDAQKRSDTGTGL
jgi:hypothetical protein